MHMQSTLSVRVRYSLVMIMLCAGSAGCSASPEDSPLSEATEGGDAVSQALTSSELLVALRTSNGVNYLTAEGDGGGAVSTNRTAVGAWERFIISDLNGGTLVSGDQVQIRHVSAAGSSWWLSADVNGGGPGSLLRANRSVPQTRETFVISKAGGGAITGGSQVSLRASNPYYVSAQQGGGRTGDGSVLVDRVTAAAWETFTLVAITPASLCPFTNSLCLFDQPNFGGARFNVSSLNPNGTCVDLASHGWAGRARSAVNTHTNNAAAFPNAGCSGGPVGITALEPTLPLLPNSVFVF
jgi:hypothetical protein